MDVVTIRKIKLNGAVMTFRAYVVDDDAHGLWTFTSPGTLVHNSKHGEIWHVPMGKGTEAGFLWLAPRDEWWFGAWWTRPGIALTNVDACTPPALVGDVWTWTDLELDICRNDTDGTVWVEDEDEFDESIALGLVDEPSQASARHVTAEMVRRLTERQAPFDEASWQRYRDVVALGLPPLPLPDRSDA